MIVSDTDEGSRMGSGTHRRLTNDRRGRQMTLNSSSISQHPSSTLQDDATYAKFLRDFTHFPSDYYHPPNSRSDDAQLCHGGIFFNPMSGVPQGAILNLTSGHQGHPEEFGLLAPGPSHFRPSFDGLDPSPTGGWIPPPGSLFDLARPTIFCVNRPLTKSA
jgi:hypothetical protein